MSRLLRSRIVFIFIAIAIPSLGLGQSEVPFHHLTLSGGAGFTTSAAHLASTLDRGGNADLNSGYFFNRHFGITGNFIFSELGVTRATLNDANEPDGKGKLYGLTADPSLRLPLGRRFSVYALGGGGYLRRTIEFTMPVAVTVNHKNQHEVQGTSTMVMATTVGNSGGFDVGGGVNMPSPWSDDVRLFLEVRYYKGFTSNINTTIIPITFGVRW